MRERGGEEEGRERGKANSKVDTQDEMKSVMI